MIPTLLAILLVNLLLLVGGVVVFWPPRQRLPGPREVRGFSSKYGPLIAAALLTLLVHLILVQEKPHITAYLGYEPQLTAAVNRLEHGFVPSLSRFHDPILDVYFSVVYIVFHPFVIYFTPILFLLTDEERAARAALLVFPLTYLVALPFYLFFPVTNVYLANHLPTPVFQLFPALTTYYYQGTTTDNTFPSLHVALALLLLYAARFSRNRPYRYFLAIYAPSVVVGVLYLQIHYVLDVLGGIATAVIVGGFIARVTAPERLALRRIKPEPPREKAIHDAARALLEKTGAKIAELGYSATPTLVGSVAKDTYLGDKVDIDIFVLFDPPMPRDDLEKKGLALGAEILPDAQARYAEHPYTRGTFEGLGADIVPAYRVASPSDRISAVDRTPFHTKYVMGRMRREQRDEARLLKQFCRGVGVYGAEARTRGFSGYLCELLVLKYGSFERVLRAARVWRPGTYLVLETVEGNRVFADPLVVLDPVDPDRNVASAVSEDALRVFAEAARAYLLHPSMSFFFPRQRVPFSPEEALRRIRRRKTAFLLIQTDAPGILEDQLHDQSRKAAVAIEALLRRHDFTVVRVSREVGERLSWLVEVAEPELADVVVHEGPPVAEGEHAARFRAAWVANPDARGPVYEEGARLFVRRRRAFRRPEEVIRAQLLSLDLGRQVGATLRKGYTLDTGRGVVRPETTPLLTQHLDPRPPWES